MRRYIVPVTETVTQLEPSGQPWIDIHYWITSLSSSLVAWFGNCFSHTRTNTHNYCRCYTLRISCRDKISNRCCSGTFPTGPCSSRGSTAPVGTSTPSNPSFLSFKRLQSATTGTGCSVLIVDDYELLSWNMWRPWKPLTQSFTEHFMLLFSSLRSDNFVIVLVIWVQYIEHKPYNIIISKLRTPFHHRHNYFQPRTNSYKSRVAVTMMKIT